MRKIFYLFLFSACLSANAHAQSSSPKDEPAKDAPTTKEEKREEGTAQGKPIDLDSFFKKGEEKAGTASCDKPAKPADSMA